MIEERLAVFDENGNKTGKKETKETVHKKGLWHHVVHVWIFNSKGEILFQKRSMKVSRWPGLWDISAAGHIVTGEMPEEGVVREIREELGLEVKLSDLKKIEIRKHSRHVPEKEYFNNEFDHIYIYKLDDISKIKFKDGEVDDVKFVTMEQLEKDIEDPEKTKQYVPHNEYYYNIINIIRKEMSK